MKDILVGTYGKTFHTWRYDQQQSLIPLGIPELVMGYTGDDQITPDFVTQRDELFGVNTSSVRESRKDITRELQAISSPTSSKQNIGAVIRFCTDSEPAPAVLPGADSWKNGFVLSLDLVNQTSETKFTASASSRTAADATDAEPARNKIEEHALTGEGELRRGRGSRQARREVKP